MYWLLIIGLLSPLVNGDDKPILQELWVPKNLVENQTIRLSCGIIKGESVEFQWYKNNEKFKETNKRKILFNAESSELVIKSLSIDDFGDYKCVGSNKYGEDLQSVSLYFNVKPKWKVEPNNVVSSLFKEIKLECKSNGYPLPLNKWIKLSDDKKTIIKEFQQSDTIKFELTKETSGYYKCISSNSIGSIEKIIKVEYNVYSNENRPILQELFVPKNLGENKTVRLNCNLLQGENVKLEWFLNDKKIDEKLNKRKILFNGESSELVIKSLSIDDFGDYKCVGSNQYGEDSQKISLYFNVKPKWIIEPEDVMSSLAREVNLECKSIGYPLAISRWIKLSDDKKTIVKEFQPSDAIKFELTKETSGYYKCISSNSIGSIEKIINVGYYGK